MKKIFKFNGRVYRLVWSGINVARYQDNTGRNTIFYKKDFDILVKRLINQY